MKSKLLFIIYLNILLSINIDGLLNKNMIIEYFKMKNIHQIIIFTCENTEEHVNFSNILMKNNFYTYIINLKTIDDDKINKIYSKIDRLGLVLNGDCENINDTLITCGNQMLYSDKYPWLIFTTDENKIISILQNVNLFVNAEIIVASILSDEKTWNLLDVYNPGYKNGGLLKVEQFGTWNNISGFSIQNSMSFPKYLRRKDLSELTFAGATVLVNPYPDDVLNYLYNNDSNKNIDNFSRYYFILFNHVRDIHNFTFTVTVTRIYGSIDKNGSFNGLVGYLQRKEVDLGLTPLYYKVDRLPFVDFLVPTYLMKTRFIFRHPKPPLTISGAFFSPLDNIVWLCTWGVMILIALIIRVSFKQEWEIERFENDSNYTEYDWSYIALLIFGGVCQQDVPRVPNLYSGRTIVFISVFFTYMLYQFYSGGIVSSLLSEPPTSIHDLEDLLYSSLKVGVEDIVYERDYFDQTNDPVAIELYAKKIVGKKNGSDAFYDVKTGMDFVREGGFAYQTDTSGGYEIVAEDFSNDIICELGEVQLYPNQYMTGVLQQNSPYRELFVYSFQRMLEAGIVHNQRLRWTTKKPECVKVVDSSTIFCSFNEFFPALLFYLVGIFFTLIIFGCEIWIHRKKLKRSGKYYNKNKILHFKQ